MATIQTAYEVEIDSSNGHIYVRTPRTTAAVAVQAVLDARERRTTAQRKFRDWYNSLCEAEGVNDPWETSRKEQYERAMTLLVRADHLDHVAPFVHLIPDHSAGAGHVASCWVELEKAIRAVENFVAYVDVVCV